MNVNQIYCDDHFAKHTNTKSPCCIPETNTMLSQLYLKICQNLKEKKKFNSLLTFSPYSFYVYIDLCMNLPS